MRLCERVPDEPSIVKATTAKAGVVLKFDVGTSRAFQGNPARPSSRRRRRSRERRKLQSQPQSRDPPNLNRPTSEKADVAANVKAADRQRSDDLREADIAVLAEHLSVLEPEKLYEDAEDVMSPGNATIPLGHRTDLLPDRALPQQNLNLALQLLDHRGARGRIFSTSTRVARHCLMTNDFHSAIRHRFYMRGECGGVLVCEVLAIERHCHLLL